MDNYSTTFGNTAANAMPAERASFIRKTYLHLAIAILAFIGLEVVLFRTGAADEIRSVMFSFGGWS
jgi:hypothetical protein